MVTTFSFCSTPSLLTLIFPSSYPICPLSSSKSFPAIDSILNPLAQVHFLKFVHSIFQVCQALSSSSSSSSSTTISPSSSSHGGGEDRCCCLLLLVLLLFSRSFFIYYWIRSLLFLLLLLLRKKGRTGADCVYDSSQRDADFEIPSTVCQQRPVRTPNKTEFRQADSRPTINKQ